MKYLYYTFLTIFILLAIAIDYLILNRLFNDQESDKQLLYTYLGLSILGGIIPLVIGFIRNKRRLGVLSFFICHVCGIGMGAGGCIISVLCSIFIFHVSSQNILLLYRNLCIALLVLLICTLLWLFSVSGAMAPTADALLISIIMIPITIIATLILNSKLSKRNDSKQA